MPAGRRAATLSIQLDSRPNKRRQASGVSSFLAGATCSARPRSTDRAFAWRLQNSAEMHHNLRGSRQAVLRQKGVGSRFRHDAGWHYGSFSGRNRLPTPFAASISSPRSVFGQAPREGWRSASGDGPTPSLARRASVRLPPSETVREPAYLPAGVAKRGSGVDFAMTPVGTTGRSAGEIDSRPLSRRVSPCRGRFLDRLLVRDGDRQAAMAPRPR